MAEQMTVTAFCENSRCNHSQVLDPKALVQPTDSRLFATLLIFGAYRLERLK